MNTCSYYYEGNFIGDELQLADFLLSKQKYLSQFGDEVFQLTTRALSTKDKIEGEIARKGREANQRLKQYVAQHGIDYDSTGRVINLEAPAMGVNKFLSKYRHAEGAMKGHRILPEFIEKEYWDRKIKDWQNKNFTEEEKDLICEIEGGTSQEARDQYRAKMEDRANFNPTKETLENWAKTIQKKWTAQGKIGSSLHAVSELFFGKNGDHYNFEDLEGDPNLVETWYNDQFKTKKDQYGKITYGDYVNLDQFKAMIDMCTKLKKQLEDQYGSDLTFYPEFTIATDLTSPFQYQNENTGKTEECKEIIGIVDLLVVDSQGRTHIFDYKTSPKEYKDYSKAKERGFTYQLAVYDRILQHYGIYTGDGSTSIIPIKLDNFRYNADTDKFEFDNVSYEITRNSDTRVNVKPLSIKGDLKVARDLDEFLPPGTTLEVYADNLLEKVQTAIRKWCPTYQQQKNMDDTQIREMIEKAGGFKPNRDGELVFKFNYGFNEPIRISADTPHPEAEMFRRVKEEIESWTYKKQGMVEKFKEDFEHAVSEGTRFEFTHARVGLGRQNSDFLSDLITPYCNGDYAIVNNNKSNALLSLGMLLLQNKADGTITVLKLTGSTLDFQHEFIDGHTYLNGQWDADIVEDSKGDSLMLKSVNGNIEAMEAMLALQFLGSNYDYKIREIKVINPYRQTGLPMTNKELLYSYSNLMKHENVLGTDTDKFKEGKLRLLDDAERLKLDFEHILAKDDFGNNPQKFSETIMPELERLNALDWNTDVSRDRLYAELNDLRTQLENLYPTQLKQVSRSLSDLLRPENTLYNQIMATMMELKGINTRQQIKDANNWLENVKVWKYGWEGLQLENPGNFKSATLNQLTKSVLNVYQKVKDRVNRENATIRRLVDNLKKQHNFGWFKSNITGNQTDMYLKMTKVDADGDFVFVNPDTLTGADKAFLEYALDTINKNRWPSYSDETLNMWKQSGDPRYYRVPLMRASDASKMSTSDMMGNLKKRISEWSPKNAKRELEEKLMGLFDDESAASLDSQEKIYEMNNIFDNGESEFRERMLTRGAEYFEHNIETILLAHSYAYELRNQMTQEMPIIKASALCLSMQGAGANLQDGNVNHLLNYIEDYVKGVVKHQQVADPKLRPVMAMTGKVQKAASFLALAFSPLQFTYQTLEGIWKACSLIIRKPDGTNAFTAKHMWDSAKFIYKDLAHYSDNPTKSQLLNETYGINDMDANQFTQRINSDHGIWTHFTDFAFRFASRADYYNRGTIFGAQMRADGTWDAHEIVDGRLVYKFDKDKRYAALKTAPKGSTEYNEALGRYLAALEQFKSEGVTNPDGSELKVGDDLPRAYTNQEAQSMKSIADNMYGYYNHETKSMFNTTYMGGLAMQMKTYWSAKKNQYLAPGGVKLQGHWEDYKEDGQQLYYQTDERGEIDLSKPFVHEGETNCSNVKVQKWRGQWQEGIFLTYSKLLGSIGSGKFKETWKDLWYNPDVNLRTAYRSNIKHLCIDLCFMFIIANLFAAAFDPWEEEERKKFNQDPTDMGKAASYTSVKFLADTCTRSFMDFNFVTSIFQPTIEWQPFAFSSISRQAQNAAKFVTTDQSFATTIANSASVFKQVKPIIKCVTYNED